MRAFFAVPQSDAYPWQAITEGLQQIGYSPTREVVGLHSPDHNFGLMVTWSPWVGSYRKQIADGFAKAGKPVIVIENGWLSPIDGVPYYQVALGGWNGTGSYPVGDGSRWASWGLKPAPWRRGGHFALVIGQKGHPADERTAKPGWERAMRLRRRSVVRRSPLDPTPLVGALEGAACCHVWSSNAASWAIMAGVPVIQHGPNLMVSDMASMLGERRWRGDRLPVLERLAWAQWSQSEIATGEPFRRLLA